MFAPMLAIASVTFDEAPAPIAIVQITALTPMTIPSIVRTLRIRFREIALAAAMARVIGLMRDGLIDSVEVLMNAR
jgi:hypothetical protein